MLPVTELAERTPITVALCGDVMLGRGIDQLFRRSNWPTLYEEYIQDARDYITLTEALHGPIERPVDPLYVWGEALDELERASPELRLINLETSITTREQYWPGKGIHYRMHPANVEAITGARVDACALANNHVMDFGREGLLETLAVLERSGIGLAGAGRNLEQARQPVSIRLAGRRSMLLFSTGTASSGIPLEWRADERRAGVDLLPDLSPESADALAARIRTHKRPGSIAVVSIHWGSNWGYAIPQAQVRFAHRLIDGGVDVIHGHSSHHPRPIELYRGKLVLYGCGDFINDYEGISGFENFRGELRALYLAQVDPADGTLVGLQLVPFESYGLRLRRASSSDSQWLSSSLSTASQPFGTSFVVTEDGRLGLRVASEGPGEVAPDRPQ